MSNSSGANLFGAGDYDSRMAFLAGKAPDAGEFSYGPGLDVPGYEDKPPSEGGRYRGTTPPCQRSIGTC
jgi:hypothetical protein